LSFAQVGNEPALNTERGVHAASMCKRKQAGHFQFLVFAEGEAG
jgi:hypothetical protein